MSICSTNDLGRLSRRKVFGQLPVCLWKFRLTRRLFERGYDRQQIVGLYRFIDWVMALPDELELEYDRQVDEYQEDRKMEYLSSMERRAMERGRQAGIEVLAGESAPRFGLDGAHPGVGQG